MATQSRLYSSRALRSLRAPAAVGRIPYRLHPDLVTSGASSRLVTWRARSAALGVVMACALLFAPPAHAGDDGTLDAAFTTANGTGANSDVRSIAVQADQKAILGGNFTTWNAAAVGRVVRLKPDGTSETAFTANTGTGASGSVWSIAVQADQKIVIGGFFATWDGVAVAGLVRLNADGTRDTAFNANTGTGANGSVWSIAVQADQKIVIGGDFTTWNGVAAGGVVRLNADGTTDAAFTTSTGTGANGEVHVVALEADQQIILAGHFTSWDGTTVGRVVRLSPGGTRETAFTTNVGTGANALVYSVVVQTDQKIVMVGDFTTWNGAVGGRIVRLSPDGTSDSTFNANAGTGANGSVWSIAMQTDQKIVMVGDFTSWNGAVVGRIVRLNTDGTSDSTFTTNTGTGSNGSVRSLAVQADQRSIIGGNLTTWNTVAVGRVARLNGTALSGSQLQPVVLPVPILQQFGVPATGTCDEAAPESLNWWGVASGRWRESWAAWMNDGKGGAVCTRTLRYSTLQAKWNVE